MMLAFTIESAPRTKKNGGNLIRRGNRMIKTNSDAFNRYEQHALLLIRPSWRQGITNAVNVRAHYFVDANRRVDLNGLNQALHDILVKAGVLADDSAINPPIVVGTDGSRVYVDRARPRTEVEITQLVS